MAKGQKKKQPRTEETQSGEAQSSCNIHFVFESEASQRLGGEKVKVWCPIVLRRKHRALQALLGSRA